MMNKATIIGTTSWGTTVGVILANKGIEVSLLARTGEEAEQLNTQHENVRHLPGVTLPERLRAVSSPREALENADLAILAVPTQTMRRNLRVVAPHVAKTTVLLSLSKGIEIESTKRVSQIVYDELGPKRRVAALSGPNFAKEVAQHLPTATVVASADVELAQMIQQTVSTRSFRAYVNEDIVGVELAGALKNVIALAVGMSDGLGYGDNTRAALITRGLAEITRLGVAAGAKPLTFSGLAGLGDLVATCTSQLSRNRYVGQELAKGRSLKQITSSMTGVAEGVDTTRAALTLAARLNVEMPIATQVFRVLSEGVAVKEVVPLLMERELKHEHTFDCFGSTST